MRASLPGRFDVPVVAYDGSAAGLSANAGTLVLIRPRVTFPQRFTELMIVEARTLRPRRLVRLRGDFSFDALSPTGKWVYLIQYTSRFDPTRYRVRAFNTHTGKLLRRDIVDPHDRGEAMRGRPITRASSPAGRWAYTLYDGNGHPFVHALDTANLKARCIDVATFPSNSDWFTAQLRIAHHRLMVVLEGHMVSQIDTRSLSLLPPTRTRTLAIPAAPLSRSAPRSRSGMIGIGFPIAAHIPSALFFANDHFAAQGTDYFAQGQPPSPFQHFWSLSVEEQFYIVWPTVFIVVLGLSFRRHARRPAWIRERAVHRVLVVVAAIALASFAWSVHSTATNPTGAYFSTMARVWELALGAGLALGASRLAGLPPRLRTWMTWSGLACIAIAAVTFSASTPFPGYAALLPTLGAAPLIVAGIAPTSSPRSPISILGTGPLRYVGDRSYAFYLWHWPVLVIAAQHAGHNLSVGTNLPLLAAAFALSIVSYGLIESPIRHVQVNRSSSGRSAEASARC